MIKAWIEMKKNEIKVKSQIYGAIAKVMEEKKEFVDFLFRAYQSLKNVPANELQTELIKAVATIVHEENKKATENHG